MGLFQLVVGIGVLGYYLLDGASTAHHVGWIHAAQSLPNGELIARDEAVQALRELSLDHLGAFRRMALLGGLTLTMAGICFWGSGIIEEPGDEGASE